MRTQKLRKAVRSSLTAALGFLTGILVLLAMPGIAPAGTTQRVSVRCREPGGQSQLAGCDQRRRPLRRVQLLLH